ncbi:MAG: chemotaxis protein CheW [Leptospira sp.]|nr:chemotaxis protein CheW [Leptospira sp.]
MSQGLNGSLQFLTWYLGTQLFGMSLEECSEVDQNSKMLKIPHSKDYVTGIINLRGDVVTILNLRKLLHFESDTRTNSYAVIRLKGKNQRVAIMADEIHDVITVSKSQLQPCPANIDEMESRYISSIAMTDSGSVIILNPEEVLRVK